MPFYLNEDGSGYYWLEVESGFLGLEDGSPPIDVPYIGIETQVFSPTVANMAIARVSQLPVEVIYSGSPKARISQAPVEVVQRSLRETVTVVIWE